MSSCFHVMTVLNTHVEKVMHHVSFLQGCILNYNLSFVSFRLIKIIKKKKKKNMIRCIQQCFYVQTNKIHLLNSCHLGQYH